MVVNGEGFFKEFVEGWSNAAKAQGNPVWLYYQKYDKALGSGNEGLVKQSEWTPVIITFLDLLGWKLGFFPLYERQVQKVRKWDLDLAWTVPPEGKRMVSIEAENVPQSVFGYRKEVHKLLADDGVLKVLVTYHDDDYAQMGSAEAWRADYLPKMLHEVRDAGHDTRPADAEFLLVLGDEVTAKPRDWYGFWLKRKSAKWDDKWTELPRQ